MKRATIKSGDDFETQMRRYFVEFPTPSLLRDANRLYTAQKNEPKQLDDETVGAFPVPSLKDEFFQPKDYVNVDDFAINVDKSLYNNSLQAFTEKLTSSFKDNDVAVVRVIFRWLAAQDLGKLGGSQSGDADSVLAVLQKISQNSGFFTDTFITMCKFAGIPVKVLKGYCKHANLEIGEDPTGGGQNTWAAVYVNNSWRFVDAHWGCTHMVGGNKGEWVLLDDDGRGKQDTQQSPAATAYAYDETYFLTNPEQWIYSHIPANKEDEDWQLLARPVTVQEFTDMAYLKPAFFEFNMALLEQNKCILRVVDGGLDLQLGTPNQRRLNFTYKLWMSKQQTFDDVELDRFCFMQQKNGRLHCRIYFPAIGKFKVEIFGKDLDDASGPSYKMLCAYVIYCDKPATDVIAFPKNQRAEWGPGPELEKAGLKPVTHDDALIETDDGTVEIRFKVERPVEVLNTLHSNTKTKDELKNNITHYFDEKTGELVLKINLPESGDYALNLFVKDEGAPGGLSNVCSYMLSTANPSKDTQNCATIPNGRLGPSRENREYKLSLVSHDVPIMTCPDSGDIDIIFKTTVEISTMTILELHSPTGIVKKENQVWQSEGENEIKYNICFAEQGVFVFKVYAKLADDDVSYQLAYSCLIIVPVPKAGCAIFPKHFLHWSGKCTLVEPKSSILPANSKVRFVIQVPGANAISTIGDGKWTSLNKDENGMWSGETETPGAGQTLQLSANMDENARTYQALLEYKIEEKNVLLEEEKVFQEKLDLVKRENEQKKLEQEKERKERNQEFENAKAELQNAIKNRDLDALQEALNKVEKKKFVSRLQNLVDEARVLVLSLQKLGSLRKDVQDMDDNAMDEMKNDADPPAPVRDVVTATLLVLGEDETVCKVWPECQKRLVTTGEFDIHKRMIEFDVAKLQPSTASRALELIGQYRQDDVQNINAGAGKLYAWTSGVIQESLANASVSDVSEEQPSSIEDTSSTPGVLDSIEDNFVVIPGQDTSENKTPSSEPEPTGDTNDTVVHEEQSPDYKVQPSVPEPSEDIKIQDIQQEQSFINVDRPSESESRDVSVTDAQEEQSTSSQVQPSVSEQEDKSGSGVQEDQPLVSDTQPSVTDESRDIKSVDIQLEGSTIKASVLTPSESIKVQDVQKEDPPSKSVQSLDSDSRDVSISNIDKDQSASCDVQSSLSGPNENVRDTDVSEGQNFSSGAQSSISEPCEDIHSEDVLGKKSPSSKSEPGVVEPREDVSLRDLPEIQPSDNKVQSSASVPGQDTRIEDIPMKQTISSQSEPAVIKPKEGMSVKDSPKEQPSDSKAQSTVSISDKDTRVESVLEKQPPSSQSEPIVPEIREDVSKADVPKKQPSDSRTKSAEFVEQKQPPSGQHKPAASETREHVTKKDVPKEQLSDSKTRSAESTQQKQPPSGQCKPAVSETREEVTKRDVPKEQLSDSKTQSAEPVQQKQPPSDQSKPAVSETREDVTKRDVPKEQLSGTEGQKGTDTRVEDVLRKRDTKPAVSEPKEEISVKDVRKEQPSGSEAKPSISNQNEDAKPNGQTSCIFLILLLIIICIIIILLWATRGKDEQEL